MVVPPTGIMVMLQRMGKPDGFSLVPVPHQLDSPDETRISSPLGRVGVNCATKEYNR
ncbi:hypothetical protein [Oscillatoria salina]|uniref:hypothetical protein n=1 Tax=Oscillatoria salina TaxID=331517 RepID=UPI0013B784DF|nr:hypothetical protein [Oscillatoria salina]MBZ8183281.1 hypothetical protein [Oscillatoria salina IIICB1]NET89231.1 hypothetical protein [Kamptonema sp. SIO1D9]